MRGSTRPIIHFHSRISVCAPAIEARRDRHVTLIILSSLSTSELEVPFPQEYPHEESILHSQLPFSWSR